MMPVILILKTITLTPCYVEMDLANVHDLPGPRHAEHKPCYPYILSEVKRGKRLVLFFNIWGLQTGFKHTSPHFMFTNMIPLTL